MQPLPAPLRKGVGNLGFKLKNLKEDTKNRSKETLLLHLILAPGPAY